MSAILPSLTDLSCRGTLVACPEFLHFDVRGVCHNVGGQRGADHRFLWSASLRQRIHALLPEGCVVRDALRYGEAVHQFFTLHAWVTMPNHVHVIVEPRIPLPAILRWLKGRTSRVANRILGRTGKPSLQDESFDHWVRTREELRELISYVEGNPVTAKLVDAAERWPWWSARIKADDEK